MPLKLGFKEKTLLALRSEKYKQNRESIGSSETLKLCCIGVAAHANGLEAIGLRANVVTAECRKFIGLTPDEAKKWIGWNDEQELTFNQIADKIEKEF